MYFVEKINEAAISPEIFERAKALRLSRNKELLPGIAGQRPLANGFAQCGCCGRVLRPKRSNGIWYMVCRGHEENSGRCDLSPVPEETILTDLRSLYHKLRHQGLAILNQLLSDLQAAQTGKMLWSSDIVELNMQIADITRQDRLLAQLKQQGLVDPDLFISRRDALAEQLRAVKLEKERLLESEENPTIAQTRVLLETLEAAPEFLDTFDEELFREIVDKIIVESNERLRFRLINGLELTEDIERTVR